LVSMKFPADEATVAKEPRGVKIRTGLRYITNVACPR
jgi:hypothetical protein